ncbi:MAG TPA: M28 family peptidase [Bryobacteraceae bacterium]|nr:M28 family peptidase [Bryobacteraceae bacterium]
MKLAKYGLLPLAVTWIVFGATANIDPNTYLDEIKFLASPELRGRATGSPELEKAGAFIAGKFREFGLKPADGKSFFQAFQVTTDARLGKANRFHYMEAGRTAILHFPEDFVPLNFSSLGKLAGAVVFVGYGITAPEYNYDDYQGVDVKGRVVLMLRHEPQEFDERSVFAGKAYTQHAQFASKAFNAKIHGAEGVILINDRANHRSDPDQLETFGRTAGPADAGIPFVQVKADKVDSWFAAAGKDLDAMEQQIDRTLKPESFAFPDAVRVDANLDVERAVKTVHNVAGYLPGETDEYVIIGAHYDHLGLGEQYSLAPDLVGTIHPGADDNASGTAGVIELARWFSKQPKQKRGILFLTFAGEELGLLGSSYYVSHPDFPLDKCAAMINMDMIGRVRNAKLYIGGAGTGTTLRALLDKEKSKFGLNLDYSDTAGYGASDHMEFIPKQVPVLFFFSGLHSDYHKPGDTWDKIDAPDAARVLQLVADITDDLRESPDRPAFVRLAPQSGGEGAAAGGVGPTSGSTSSGGYGPYFGSIPDFGEGVKGVKFSDVTPGSPAAKAGFKADDVLVEFDGKPIQNLYDFTYALQAKKPDDVVKVKVLRNGKPVEAMVTLVRRH